MFLSGDVKEKAESVLALVATQVTLERLPAAVVAHVDRVHGGVLEGDAAELAGIQFRECFSWPADRHKAWHL